MRVLRANVFACAFGGFVILRSQWMCLRTYLFVYASLYGLAVAGSRWVCSRTMFQTFAHISYWRDRPLESSWLVRLTDYDGVEV